MHGPVICHISLYLSSSHSDCQTSPPRTRGCLCLSLDNGPHSPQQVNSPGPVESIPFFLCPMVPLTFQAGLSLVRWVCHGCLCPALHSSS